MSSKNKYGPFLFLIGIALLILILGLLSCSNSRKAQREERKIEKTVHRHGEKNILAYLVRQNPELFHSESDSIIVYDTVYVNDEFILPEEFEDTTEYEEEPNKCKRDFYYTDKNIYIEVHLDSLKDRLIYRIFPKKISNKIAASIATKCPPCKPCPDINNLPKEKVFIDHWWIKPLIIYAGLCTMVIFVFLIFPRLVKYLLKL